LQLKKQAKSKHFIDKPVYLGGTAAMKKFIYKELKYPQEALKEKIEGLVIVRYDIDYKGKVTNTKVISSLGSGCDEEAERVIKLLKFQVPKTPRKLKVVYHKTTRIQFKLPAQKQGVKYSYTQTQKKEQNKEQAPKSKNKSFHYTIRY
jgi:protein TonB